MESPCRAFRCNSAGSRENQMVASSSPTQCLAVTSPSQLEGGNSCCGVGAPAPLVMVDTAVNPCPCRPSGTCLDITQQPTSALTFHQQRLAMSEAPSVYNTGLCGISTPNFHSDAPGLFTLGCHPTTESFFSNPVPGFDTKESLDASWRLMPYTPFYYPYDMSSYSLAASYGMDWNGARRKNATRETTSTLKAWLNEHRKNPYPTKGEKIMLAIITKMTLTQVSTWFANARRRLKKENKMTWEPRNLCDEDCDADSASDHDDSDAAEKVNPVVPDSSERQDIVHHGSSELFSISSMTRKCDTQSSDLDNKTATAVFKNANKADTISSKPRIWSIADMATSASTTSGDNFMFHNQVYPSAANLDITTADSQKQFAISRWSTDSSRSSSFIRVTPSSMSTTLSESVEVPSYLPRLKKVSERYSSSNSTPIEKSSDLTQTTCPSSESLTVQNINKESQPNSARSQNGHH